MEDLLLPMVERASILLLILGRDSIHQCLESEAIISFQSGAAAATQIHRRRTILFILLTIYIVKVLIIVDILHLIVTSRRLSLGELDRGCRRRGVGQDHVLI